MTTIKSSEFYKVVNAICNTLRNGVSVATVSGGNGGSGFAMLDYHNYDIDIRKSLVDGWDDVRLIDDEADLLPDWADIEHYDDECAMYELYNYNNNSVMQVQIDQFWSASSHDVRDMIVEDLGGDSVETSSASGAVICCDNLDEAEKYYGVSRVVLSRKCGRDTYSVDGSTTLDKFDLLDIVDMESGLIHATQADAIENIKMVMAEMAATDEDGSYDDISKGNDLIESLESLNIENNHCIEIAPDYSDYTVCERYVSKYEDDSTWYYIGLDCSIL